MPWSPRLNPGIPARVADKEDVSPVSETLAVSAAGAATSQQRRRQKPPLDEPEDIVELSSEARAAGEAGDDEEPSHQND